MEIKDTRSGFGDGLLELAQSNKIGMWRSNFIKPWDWRKKEKRHKKQ